LADYGAWIDLRYTNYKDDDNDSTADDTLRETFEADNRFWLKLNIKPPVDASYDNEHVVYVRLKDLYLKRFPEDTTGDYDHDGPHLDYAYTILDLHPYKMEIGRKYFNIGRGIVYSNVNDGLQINYLRPKWNIGVLAAHTLPHEDNIDTSVPGYSKDSDRYYFAVGVGYAGIPGHQLYGYSLVQRDFSYEEPNNLNQEFRYDSEYLGLGSKGTIIQNWDYWAEIIKQSGESHIWGTNEASDVDAWAANIGSEYSWEVKSRPRFSLEYAYGSGDSERTSVTDTQGGNLSGKDNNFLYFGYFPSGYALAPRLSNIHIYRTGVSIQPFEQKHLLKNLMLGVDYFWYFKDKSEGGMSDPEAVADSHDIGRELDLKLSWQLLSDLTWSVNYGFFIPGDAYLDSANDRNHYFSQGLTVTF
jgi:hypothetical protein